MNRPRTRSVYAKDPLEQEVGDHYGEVKYQRALPNPLPNSQREIEPSRGLPHYWIEPVHGGQRGGLVNTESVFSNDGLAPIARLLGRLGGIARGREQRKEVDSVVGVAEA